MGKRGEERGERLAWVDGRIKGRMEDCPRLLILAVFHSRHCISAPIVRLSFFVLFLLCWFLVVLKHCKSGVPLGNRRNAGVRVLPSRRRKLSCFPKVLFLSSRSLSFFLSRFLFCPPFSDNGELQYSARKGSLAWVGEKEGTEIPRRIVLGIIM